MTLNKQKSTPYKKDGRKEKSNSRSISIPDFRVSTAIINHIDIVCRWCKLNFGPKRGQVKSCYFSERIHVWRKYFYLLYKFLGIIAWKQLG